MGTGGKSVNPMSTSLPGTNAHSELVLWHASRTVKKHRNMHYPKGSVSSGLMYLRVTLVVTQLPEVIGALAFIYMTIIKR